MTESGRNYDAYAAALGDRPIEELVDLPLDERSGVAAAMDVSPSSLPPALFTDENLL